MEHDGCCFIAGAGAAGRNHLSGADAAAVRTAAVWSIGHHSIPPVGGMGDWGLPQQARLSYKRYACNYAAQGGRGFLNSADNTPYEKNGDEVRSLADEVPFDIPDSWEWVRIRSLGEIVRGSGIKRNETVPQGCPCVRYGELYTTYQTSFTSAA